MYRYTLTLTTSDVSVPSSAEATADKAAYTGRSGEAKPGLADLSYICRTQYSFLFFSCLCNVISDPILCLGEEAKPVGNLI